MIFWFFPSLVFICPLLAFIAGFQNKHFLEVRTYNYFTSVFLLFYFLYFYFLKKMSFNDFIEKMERNYKPVYINIFFISAAIFISLSQVLTYYSVKLNAVDFSIFDRMLASTWQGLFMLDDSVNYFNHFAIHQNYILFILLPFWKLFESPVFLQFTSSVLIILASFLLYKINYNTYKKHVFSFVISIFFLTSPYIAVLLDSNFRPEQFYPLAVFLMIFCLQKQNYIFIISLLIFLSIKEDAAFYGIGFGFGILFMDSIKLKYKIRMSIITVFSSITMLIFNLNFIQPFFLKSENIFIPSYLNFWSHLGKSKQEIIFNIFNNPLSTLNHMLESGWLKLYLPFLFIPLFNIMCLSSSIFGILLLSTADSNSLLYKYGSYYPIVLFSFAVIALHQALRFVKLRVVIYFVLLISPLLVVGWLDLPRVNWTYRDHINQAKNYLMINKNSMNSNICIQHILVPQFGYFLKLKPLTEENLENNKCHFIVLTTEKGIDSYPFETSYIHNLVESYSNVFPKLLVKFGNIYIIQLYIQKN